MKQSRKKQFVIDQDGKKVAVLIPIEEYERLLEDLHDLAVIAERRDEPTISAEELKRRLRVRGLLPLPKEGLSHG